MAEEHNHEMAERDISLAALDEADPLRREAVIEECCGGNAKVRARIESLLRHHANDSPLLGAGKAEGTWMDPD